MENKEYFDYIEAIDIHLDNFVDPEEVIEFYDVESEKNPIDIYWIKPNNEFRPYSILMTCGLSAKPMIINKTNNKNEFVELVMLLPKDWDLDDKKLNNEKQNWPIEHLRSIAKIPFEDNTGIGFGDLFNYDEDENFTFPGTNFTGSIIFNSITLPDEFTNIEFNTEKIKLLVVIPLYIEELHFVEDNEPNLLIDKFNKTKITDIVDLSRINTCL